MWSNILNHNRGSLKSVLTPRDKLLREGLVDLSSILRRYFRYGHHEAIITTIDMLGNANVAPMGVFLSNDYVVLRPYVSTRTYRNLTEVPEAVVNVTNDSVLFYKALYEKNSLRLRRARVVRVPIIDGPIDLYIECNVEKYFINNERATIYLKPLCVYEGPGSKIAFSRANSLLIEVLVYLTKISARVLDVNEVKDRIECFLSIIERLGSEELILIAKSIRSKLTLKDLRN